jgi:hypothetical protein
MHAPKLLRPQSTLPSDTGSAPLRLELLHDVEKGVVDLLAVCKPVFDLRAI